MKQTIEIDVPEGYKAVWNNNKVEFVKIQPELPKTWEEFCEKYSNISESEYYINGYSNICKRLVKNSENVRNSEIDKNTFPSKEAAVRHLVLMQLHQLRDCYRQGWTPDWTNPSINKYVIINVKDYICTDIHTSESHFLSFQSEELAVKFLTNFKDLIKQAGDLI